MARILLVEDHQEIWDFLSRRLKRRGHEISVAEDGQAGLDQARAEKPELILLDMNLPVMDGWTVAETLKGDAATKHIPIIALTAHAMSGDREKAVNAGCDDYHAKPIDFSQLLNQIDSALSASPSGTPNP